MNTDKSLVDTLPKPVRYPLIALVTLSVLAIIFGSILGSVFSLIVTIGWMCGKNEFSFWAVPGAIIVTYVILYFLGKWVQEND